MILMTSVTRLQHVALVLDKKRVRCVPTAFRGDRLPPRRSWHHRRTYFISHALAVHRPKVQCAKPKLKRSDE
ncbi:unnamed protein product, partial [Iphiclides podalirius]